MTLNLDNRANDSAPWSRRRLLQSGLGWGLVASLPPGSAAAQPTAGKADEAAGYIDAHSHVWTPDTARFPLAAGFRLDEMQPPSFTPQELMAHARPLGVGRAVLIQMSFYGFDNSYLLAAIAASPGAYSGVAVIDDAAARPADEMRRLKKLGVRGFRIYPRTNPVDKWLDHDGLTAMWRAGAADRLAMCHLVNPSALPSIDRMCERFPDTPVVVDHLARIGVDGQIRDDDVAALCRLARHKHTCVKVSAFYALGKRQAPYLDLAPLVRRVYDAFGPQRLMWASDCPFQVQGGHTYRDSLALVAERLDFLSNADRQWLLGRTAQAVFFS